MTGNVIRLASTSAPSDDQQTEPETRSVIGQVPPSDLDAEGVVLSSMLLDFPEGAVAAVRGVLEPKHFYADANRRIYEAILAIVDAGKAVDSVALASHLRDQNLLFQVGGAVYIAVLTDAQPACRNVLQHAARVVEMARRRQLLDVMHVINLELRGGSLDHAGARALLREHFVGSST